MTSHGSLRHRSDNGSVPLGTCPEASALSDFSLLEANKGHSCMGQSRPFKLESKSGGPVKKKFVSMVGRPLEHMLGLSALNTIYATIQQTKQDDNFMQNVLDTMGISYAVPDEKLKKGCEILCQIAG